jgi:hypothetical protein
MSDPIVDMHAVVFEITLTPAGSKLRGASARVSHAL